MDLSFNYPQQPNSALSQSAFQFQYDPKILTAYSANPNANIQGGISPTGQQSLTFQNNSTQNTQNTSATDIVQPKLQSYGPSANNTTSGSTTQSSSSGLNSNALNLVSAAGQRSGVGKSLLSGVTNSIDNFGVSLGFGSGPASLSIPSGLSAGESAFLGSAQAASGVVEGGVAGSLGTTASLSGVLGAAGLGFMGGGILAHAIGGNETGGSIGGALGAAAGYAFGGAGAAALGMELGAFAGPIGAIVGGIGGALFGSMFGNSTPATNADAYYNHLNPDGTATGGVTNGKNAGPVSGYSQKQVDSLGNIFQGASRDLGIDFSGLGLESGISTRHPGAGGSTRIDVNQYDENGVATVLGGTENNYFNPDDKNSKTQAQLKVLQAAAAAKGYTDTDKLNQWFSDHYITGNSMSGASNAPPSIPNNPNGGQSDFQKFLENFKAQQNANAAPTPTS